MLEEILTDAALFAGLALVTAGAYLQYGPVSLIIGGALLMAGALLYARGGKS